MRYNFRTILAVACVGVFALSGPAYSKPQAKAVQLQKRADSKKISAKSNPLASHQVKQARDLRYGLKSGLRPPASRDGSNEAARAYTPISQFSARPTFGWPALVTEARKYIGTNPTAMNKRWCARFMNLVLTKAGYSGTGSDAARSFASYGRRVSEPRVGAIAVLSRGKNRNFGHVGVVTGLDPRGNPIIISGNHGRRVGEGLYSRDRVIAYVMPAEQPQLAHAQSATSSDADREGIPSPIAELLAAINNESPREPRRVPQPSPARERVVQQMPQTPPVRVRLVEQTPPTVAPPPQAAGAERASQAERHSVPLDPALAKFLGINNSNVAEPQPMAPRRRVAAGLPR
jgi:uncharacterized protein (TIGR02594 family)